MFAKVVCHPLVGNVIAKAYGGRIPSRGGRLRVDTTYVQPQSIASIFWRLHERSEAILIDRFLNRALDVVELGSSLGVISLQIMHLQQRSKRLICVEANPHLANMLSETVASMQNSGKVFVLNRAISLNREPAVHFEINEAHLGSHIVSSQNESSISVATVSLGRILADYEIGDYVLVSDVEGAEAGIILNEPDKLSRCRQLIIELHDVSAGSVNYTVEQMRSLITTELGFRQLARRRNVFVFSR